MEPPPTVTLPWDWGGGELDRLPICCGSGRLKGLGVFTDPSVGSASPSATLRVFRCVWHGPFPDPRVATQPSPHLVTGGLGGLGLVTAGWLAAQGADRIVLIGRRAAPAPEAADWHQRLLASGVRVDVERCDVARLQAVAEVVATACRIRNVWRPLSV